MRHFVTALALLGLLTAAAHADEDATTPGTIVEGRGTFPILQTIDLENTQCVGVGYDGTNFWVSAGDGYTGVCEFYVYDEYGNLLVNVPQGAGATGWGHRDMAFNGTYMFGSYSPDINGFDSAQNHMGYFVGPLSPNRALAYDGEAFYTCGFGELLYHVVWDGVWGSTGIATPYAGPFDGAYGLAYDAVLNCLWMTTANYTGELLQLDMYGNITDVATTLPEYDIHGGCTMADTIQYGYVLVVLVQSSPDQLVFYDLGHPTATEETTLGNIKALYR
jgi:hypothetical protein